MTDFLHTDARWTERFVEVNDPHKEGHHVRFYFEPPQRTWVGLTEDERYKLWLTTPSETENRFAFAEAIEQALKEKNT
jgi:hypothetical protein